MPVTVLDRNVALVVIDLQKGIAGRPTVHPFDAVVDNAGRLAEAFRSRNLTVVLVNVVGGAPGRTEQHRNLGNLPRDWSELLPQLNEQTQDHIVTKRTWGAFTNTDLEVYLRDRDITQIVLAGVATSVGVESTARFAHEYGFNVALALDAMTDMSAEAHEHSVTRIFPRLGETGTSQEIIDLLDKGARNDGSAMTGAR